MALAVKQQGLLPPPGINIGPEPTTDRFVVVESGLDERRTPGNTLVVQPSKPYQVCGAADCTLPRLLGY